MSSESAVATLGYWPARGVAHPIKMLLEYTSTPYKLWFTESGPAPTFSKQLWLDVKYDTMKDFDIPNLPYYDDGKGLKITQTKAILMHLGRVHGLVPDPKDEQANIDADMVREFFNDWLAATTGYVFFPAHRAQGKEPTAEEKSAKRAAYKIAIDRLLKDFARKCSHCSGKWTIGNTLTYIDFIVYENIDQARLMLGEDILAKTPKIKEFMKQFEELPNLKEYFASDRFSKFPILTDRAYFGFSKGN